MTRLSVALFLMLAFLPLVAFAAQDGKLPQSAPRNEAIEAVGTLTFVAGHGYKLNPVESATIAIAIPGSAKPVIQIIDPAAMKNLVLTLRVAESKTLVRQLEGLTGKRVLVKGTAHPSLDSVTHDIQANEPGFSITEAAAPAPPVETAAPKPSGTCDTAEDCRPACKGAGKGSECDPDGIPSCKDHQCSCDLNCL